MTTIERGNDSPTNNIQGIHDIIISESNKLINFVSRKF
jgi:hypothetical protein